MFLKKHIERLRAQYVLVQWPEEKAEAAWARENLKVVIGTADKMRMALSTNPWWARGRCLEYLLHDEIENEQVPDLAALAAHFKQVTTAGDEQQRLSKLRRPPPAMPCGDPQSNGASAHGTMVYADAPAGPWLRAYSDCILLNKSERFGCEIIDLATRIDPGTHSTHQANGAKSTEIVYVSYKHERQQSNGWETLDQSSTEKSCVLHRELFMIIGSAVVTHARMRKRSAVIMFYKGSVEAMEKYM